MKRLFPILLLVLGTACTTSSGGEDPSTDSQTHWLVSCQDDADCQSGLACLCGVCTSTCDADAACSDLDAACVPSDQGAANLLCAADEVPAGICLPECTIDDDCPGDQVCRQDSCVPTTEVVDNNAGCPDNQIPECAEGSAPVQLEDSAGCPYFECQPINCPPIAPPDPELCDGNEPQPTIDDGGCVTGFTCPEGCPMITPPSPDFCGDEQGLEPVYDDLGCVISYECVDPVCPDLQLPECAQGQGLRSVEDSAGCFTWFCIDGGTHACGDMITCDIVSQYCDAMFPGVPDSDPSYQCVAIPPACLPTTGCPCIVDALGIGPESECREGAEGGIRVSTFLP